MHSIRTTITVITIIVILTSILSVFTASYLIIQSETRQNSVGMMNLIDEDTQKSLEKYFESIEQSVEVSANFATEDLDSVFLVECGAVRTEDEKIAQTSEQIENLDSYIKKYCDKVQKYFSSVADYTQGVSAYYFCISPEVSRTEHGFYYRKIGKTGFIEHESIDVLELPVSETLNATWYNVAVSHGRPAWVGPYKSVSDKGMMICSYFVPIYKAGMLIGVMGMDIPYDILADQVRDIHVYETGYVCLLDSEGRIIYHPQLPIGSDPDEIGLSARDEIIKNESSGDELIEYTLNGEEREMAFSTLSNGMKLVSVAPAAEINAPWIRLVRAIAFIAIVVIIVFGIVIFFVMRAITFPLKQLTAAAQQLADSDYDVDLSYHEDNEIGTLTSSFVRMREQIGQYIEDLNHQIYHDRLTDLPNMRHFFTLAVELRDQLVEEGREPVMLYFDIIGMRNYNRQYGFDRGDDLIVNFAGIIAREFGDHRVCRLNGDSFMAVTDEASVDEELQHVLLACETAMDGNRLSIRVGLYPNKIEEVDVNVACDRAQFAGDIHKGDIASSVTYFTETMLKKGDLYRYIINNLDKALEEGWVKVYYQPIVRSSDGKICDEEALARWIDPDKGFLSPGDFIPALEESKLIYKLDLYMVEQVLEKMKRQKDAGLYLVPQSINLSRMDFESCDIVEEIRHRVDSAGIGRDMITIEITESVIGSDFDFMKEQIERFRELGFPVWMDDFGSGYSSLDVLQHVHFDLIKFDMRFMECFYDGDESKIILTELMNMAIGLGTETVCEGVEHEEQVEFLREIGCTRIQGYYYGKPVPFEDIVMRKGLEYENPEESEYYASIGRINLYDISALSEEKDDSLTHYFNTLPMSIMEVNGSRMRYNRCNRSFRDFLHRTMSMEYSTEEIDIDDPNNESESIVLKAVAECAKDGSRIIIDDRLEDGTVTHTLIRRVAVNPVTGTAAVAVAVLAVTEDGEKTGTNYSQIARALATNYMYLYYVDLDTEDYVEYRSDVKVRDLVMERFGKEFFADGRRNAMTYLYGEDQEDFIKAFTKENVLTALDSEGRFEVYYRLTFNNETIHAVLKAMRMPGDKTHILVGVREMDAPVQQ